MEIEKLISIYKTKKEFIIYPKSQTQFGFWRCISPVFKIPFNCEKRELLQILKDAFERSNKEIIICDSNNKETNSRFLKELGVKSWLSLYNNSISCSLYQTNNKIEFIPYKHEGRKGNFPIKEKQRVFDVNDFDSIVELMFQGW